MPGLCGPSEKKAETQMIQLRARAWRSVRIFAVAVASGSAFYVSAVFAEQIRPAPAHLEVESTTDPIGIDALHPRLSWQLAFDERGAAQTAYQIQVAATSRGLAQGNGISWDTGRVMSEQSVFVPYEGPALDTAQRCYWRVRVWDEKGNASAWSAAAFWEMGLLHASEWQASFITPDWDEDAAKPRPVPVLRKGFTLSKAVVSARLYATSLGLYEMELNGHRVGDDVLTPGWTSYNKRLQYQVYDVTAMVKKGENGIGATLGEGWYRGQIGPKGTDYYGSRLALIAQLRVTYADGSTETVVTDKTWKASTGPIVSSTIYDGETHDARLDKTGWSEAGYNDHGWAGVRVLEHSKDTLVAQEGPAAKRQGEVRPLAMLRAPDGNTIFDMGQNMVGWLRLKVRGPAGTTVTLRDAEVLNKDGSLYLDNLRSAKETLTYTLKGGGDEVFEPHFTYQGFRYVEVAGYPGELTLGSLTGVAVYADMAAAGSWESWDGRLNRLEQNIVWSQKGNFVVVPTDCPQRDERLGWTGDAQVFASTATENFDVDGFLSSWLRDLAADQYDGGEVPAMIPDGRHSKMPHYEGDGRSGWGDAAVIVPWTLYLNYGDKRVLAVQYDSMKSWVEWLRRKNPGSLITDLASQHGDWLAYAAPPVEARAYPGATTGLDLVATAYYAHVADLLARTATVLGKSEDAGIYRTLFEQIRTAWEQEYVTTAGRVGENTQAAYTLALQFDLLPPEMREQAAQRLGADVTLHKNHLTTGFLGTPGINFMLSEYGQTDAAYALLEQETYPSWLYPITMGATTMWEHWDGIKPDGSFYDPSMNSYNHYAFGAIGDWMYRVVAGIDLDPAEPGYKHVLIQPQPGGGLGYVRATRMTGYGEIASSWAAEGDVLQVSVTVPPNTHATVKLPGAMLAEVKERGKVLAGDEGVTNAQQHGDDVIVDTGAGTYVFAYRGPAALMAKLNRGVPYSVDDKIETLLADPKTYRLLGPMAPVFTYEKAAKFLGVSMRVAAEMDPTLFPGNELQAIDKALSEIRH